MLHNAVYRSQINPSNIIVNTQEFMDKIQGFVKDFGYYFDDTKYKYKEGKKEIDFVMFRLECKREIDNYAQFEIHIDVQFEHAIKTKKGLKTGGKIIIGSWINLDYDNKWAGNPFLTILQGIYNRYIYKPTLKRNIAIVATEHEAIENKIKKYIRVHEVKT